MRQGQAFSPLPSLSFSCEPLPRGFLVTCLGLRGLIVEMLSSDMPV